MELLYYWIDEDITLKQTGFHFSDRFNFSLNFQESELEVRVGVNKSYNENFFGKNISSITAIIGENGVGKTSLLTSLIERLTGYRYVFGHEFLIAFFDGKKILIFETFSSNGGFDKVFSENKNVKIKAVEESHNLHGDGLYDKVLSGKSMVVYNNPIYDLKDYPFDVEDRPYSDISSTYLLWADKEKNTSEKYDMVTFHRSEEVKRQLDFISQGTFQFKKDLFNYPSELEVEVLRFDKIDETDLGFEARRIHEVLREFASIVLQKHNDLVGKGRKKSELQKREKAKSWLLTNIFDFYFYQLANAKDDMDKLTGCTLKELPKFHAYSSLTDKNQKLEYFYGLTIGDLKKCIFSFFEKQKFVDGSGLKSMVNYLFQLVDDHGSTEVDNAAAFSFDIDNANEFVSTCGVIVNTLTKNDQFFTVSSITRAKWRNLSSGELSFLNLFSRFYNAIVKLSSENRKVKHIYLLIDEGDIGLHPHWQKQLISKCIEFLACFKKLTFQLVVTSHSPIILSDIPKSNVLFLSKEEGLTKINSNDKRSETFGANIHMLFRDSFFMKGGLIGEFAQSKIDEIVEKVNEFRKHRNLDDLEELNQLIQMIGEPILRKTLESKLSDLGNDDLKISLLQQEIDRLKSKKK